MSAFEFSRMMPSPSFLAGGTTMGKACAQSSGISVERIGRRHRRTAPWLLMRLQRLFQRAAHAILRAVDHAHMPALDRIHGGEAPDLAQAPVRAGGEVHAGRIGAIDDVEIVIAGQHQHPPVKGGMRGESVEHFGPFGGNPGVGHVAGDEDGVELVLGVERLELLEQPLQAFIA